jgi:hypothetical protein
VKVFASLRMTILRDSEAKHRLNHTMQARRNGANQSPVGRNAGCKTALGFQRRARAARQVGQARWTRGNEPRVEVTLLAVRADAPSAASLPRGRDARAQPGSERSPWVVKRKSETSSYPHRRLAPSASPRGRGGPTSRPRGAANCHRCMERTPLSPEGETHARSAAVRGRRQSTMD